MTSPLLEQHLQWMKSLRINCRLLYLIGQLGMGGCERQLCYLLQSMDRERYRPAVAVWNLCHRDVYASHIRALGIPLYSFPGTLSGAAKLKAFRRLVKELEPEVVHSYSFYTNFAARWGTLGLKIVLVGSIRNNFVIELRLAGRVLGRLSARWPETQICNSIAAKNAVKHAAWPFKPSRLHVVHNRLDIGRFRYVPSLPDKPTLLAVGRLHPEKRWDRLLKVIAFAAASSERFLVRHVGEGFLLENLQAQARKLGVSRLIEFLGTQSDIGTFLEDSTFLIHTADDEGCPNVVMEAMACGRAVVATDAGDIPYLVEDGKTGFVVRRGDDATLAKRMLTLIADRDLCQRMGEAGRAKAEREFGLNHLISETLAVYRTAGWKDF
jgi:glycosyltransferase involved in cell wall biosynthesis